MGDSDKLPDDILRWQEDMFILSCALYVRDHDTVLSDSAFDEHCSFLLRKYDQLSLEFRNRVPRSNLECGTQLGLEFTEEEFFLGVEWFNRVKLNVGTNQ